MPYRDDGMPDIEALARHREERAAAHRLPRESGQSRAGVSSRATTMRRFYEALAARYLLLLDEAYADFVDEAELLAAHLRRSPHSAAHVFEGLRNGRRANRLRARPSATSIRTFQKIRLQYGVNRNAQIGALASLQRRRFSQARRRRDGCARATTTTRSRASWASATSNRAPTSSASTWRRRAAQRRVMNELLVRGVWIRKPGAAAARLVHSRQRRYRADATSLCRPRFARYWPSRRMRYAIVSDVHGNLESLERALAAMQPGDALVSLGDVVGYGPNPNECVAVLRERCKPRRIGQSRSGGGRKLRRRELQQRRARGDRLDAERARRAKPRVAQRASVRAALSGVLARPRRSGALLRVHPRQRGGRASLRAHRRAHRLRRPHAHRRVLGLRRAMARSGTSTCSMAASSRSRPEALHHRRRQRRTAARSQSASRPSCVYDTEQRRVEWIRYAYPIEEVQRKMRAAGLPAYLVERLAVGR